MRQSFRTLAFGVILIVAAVMLVAPAPAGISPTLMHAAGLAVFAIGAWASGALPEHVTTVAFFLLAMAFHIAPAHVVFSGFESTAWWLVFGGLIVGIAVQRTGLGARLALVLCRRLAGSYVGAVTGVVAVAIGLAFLMPSTLGRLVLLMPIVVSLADHLGFTPESQGRRGLVMAVSAASYMPACSILPANVPNSVLIGAADSLYGIKLTYGPYLLLHFPVLGALKAIAIIWFVLRLFPDTPRAGGLEDKREKMSRDERILAAILGLSLAFFVTDFLHGISPAWVSLAAGLVCLLPGIELVPPKAFAERMNFSALLYVAGILGLGAVVGDSGLGVALGHVLLAVFQPTPGADAYNFTVLVGLALILGVVTTMPGLPAVLTTLSGELARASGLPVLTVMMTQVLGFSTAFHPYQSPPMVVAMQLGGASMRDGFRLCLPLAILTLLVLFPLDYLWWRVLGMFG